MTDPRELFRSLRAPVIGAPMFLVSGPALVIEQCTAGIIGAFPALNARPQEALDVWLTKIEDALAAARKSAPDAKIAPFAVNLIVNPANKRLEQDFETCVKHKVPIIITSLHAPTAIFQEVVRAALGTWYRELVTDLPVIRDGLAHAPQGAGLGARLDPAVVRRQDATVRVSGAPRA